jgi:DNA-binding XRE family transcriptional regulator
MKICPHLKHSVAVVNKSFDMKETVIYDAGMTLNDYLHFNRVTATAFASRIGVSRQTIHNWKSGKAWPTATAIYLMMAETKGEVTDDDFL